MPYHNDQPRDQRHAQTQRNNKRPPHVTKCSEEIRRRFDSHDCHYFAERAENRRKGSFQIHVADTETLPACRFSSYGGRQGGVIQIDVRTFSENWRVSEQYPAARVQEHYQFRTGLLPCL
ncbi:MAG: hypothetical protein BWY06_03502 [Candidatus Latescibacteria bacterium ADurb.Bin168]|nr:MAG: hypothetical protein BWY06_03502 [Candidatus Latescibacteria bacterium ADurb.Bin168]